MKESRKIEDLILPFVTTATKSLKKEDELADGAWKYELNTQISLFLDLIADSLQAVGPVPPELSSRLEGYRTRIKAPDPPPGSEKGSSERGHGERGDAESVKSIKSEKREAQDGFRARETESVGEMFGLTQEILSQKLRDLQGVCTEQAAIEDLKVKIQVFLHCTSQVLIWLHFSQTPQHRVHSTEHPGRLRRAFTMGGMAH